MNPSKYLKSEAISDLKVDEDETYLVPEKIDADVQITVRFNLENRYFASLGI